MTTKLYCPGCDKQCGDAKLLDDIDVVHVTMFKERRRGQYSGLTVHLTQGRTLRLSDPDGWPLDWRCEQCRTTTVRLTAGQARRVGHVERLRAGSMPDD
jgi:hypothetical protein